MKEQIDYWKQGTEIIEKALSIETSFRDKNKNRKGIFAEEQKAYCEGIIAGYVHALEMMGYQEIKFEETR